MLTSAVRDAANGREFAATVEHRYGLEPHILTGDEEAGLTFLGATSERDPDDRTPTLVFDIGGGSTELVIGTGHEMSFHVSTQAGVVRQTERHIHTDPPTEAELDALRDDVRAILDRGRARGPASRGRARDRRRGNRDVAGGDRAGARALRPGQGPRLRDRAARSPSGSSSGSPRSRSTQRREVPGLHPDRAPTIVAGVIILLEVLDLFGLDARSRSQSTTSSAAPRSGSAATSEVCRAAAEPPADVRALGADRLGHQRRRASAARTPGSPGSTAKIDSSPAATASRTRTTSAAV